MFRHARSAMYRGVRLAAILRQDVWQEILMTGKMPKRVCALSSHSLLQSLQPHTALHLQPPCVHMFCKLKWFLSSKGDKSATFVCSCKQPATIFCACCRPPPPPGAELSAQSNNTFDGLRSYLRQLATAAYQQKAAAVEDIEGGLMQEAQKFFVLTQTDNLWKEHLQVGGCSGRGVRACGGRGLWRGGGHVRLTQTDNPWKERLQVGGCRTGFQVRSGRHTDLQGVGSMRLCSVWQARRHKGVYAVHVGL
jgi:hypothetical protein